MPKTNAEALAHPSWQHAMNEEMLALFANGTWDLIPFPLRKSLVGCRWIFTIKTGPDGSIGRLKARWLPRVIHRSLFLIMEIPFSLDFDVVVRRN